jgi:hypothetical protein
MVLSDAHPDRFLTKKKEKKKDAEPTAQSGNSGNAPIVARSGANFAVGSASILLMLLYDGRVIYYWGLCKNEKAKKRKKKSIRRRRTACIEQGWVQNTEYNTEYKGVVLDG